MAAKTEHQRRLREASTRIGKQTPRDGFIGKNQKDQPTRSPHNHAATLRQSEKTHGHDFRDIHTTRVRHGCPTPSPIHHHGRRRAKKAFAGVVSPFVRDEENSPDRTTEKRCLPDDKRWEEKRAVSLGIALGGGIGSKTYRRRRR